jgi:hypothetical protein
MSTVEKGVFLLPTRRRLDKLREFFEAARAAGTTAKIVLIVCKEEYDEFLPAYAALISEFQVRVFLSDLDGGAAYKCQSWWEWYCKYEHELNPHEWVGFLSDDYTPVTPEWDRRLAEQIKGWNVVSCDDGWQSPKRLAGAILWSVPLIEAMGFLAIPGTQHHYWDDPWEIVGATTQCWQCDMSVLVRHRHSSLEAKPIDSTTARLAELVKDDGRLFDDWRQNQRDATVERINALMDSMGMKKRKIDLSHIKLLICSPCGSGRYHRTYVKSMLKTFAAFRQYGATVDWHDHPFASDPPFARAMLFGAFWRSSFTHMLQVDDDMEWNFIDLVRMLWLDREFVAAAGPAKVDEPRFAVSSADEFGNPIPPRVEAETNVMHATHVGGAFVLINRSCAEKMVAAYGDLEFLDNSGQSTWGLYHPYVRNRKHVGEDFAFCERWRAIGGRVDVLTDVALGHSGDKTWTGRLSDWMIEKFQEAQEQAARENENAKG